MEASRRPAPGDCVRGLQDLYDRIVGLLHEAVFDDAGWPETAAVIDAAWGIKAMSSCSAKGEGRTSTSVSRGSASAGSAARIGMGVLQRLLGAGRTPDVARLVLSLRDVAPPH